MFKNLFQFGQITDKDFSWFCTILWPNNSGNLKLIHNPTSLSISQP